MLSGLGQWCAAVLRRFFRLQMAGMFCSSRVENKTVSLPREFVQGAAALHIELSILWPLFLPAFRPPPLSVQLIAPDNQPVGDGLRFTSAKSFRGTRIAVDIAGDQLKGRQSFRVRVVRHKDTRRLAEVDFVAITVDGVARELRLVRLEMRAMQQGRAICCDQFHDAVEQLLFRLELRLDNPDHRSFLNQMEVALHAKLAADASTTPFAGSWWQQCHFKNSCSEWEQRLGSAKTVFADVLGEYRLSIALGAQIISTKAFRVRSLKDCQDAARHRVQENASLVEAGFSTVNHRRVAGPLGVVAEDFFSLDVSLGLDAPQPDPLLPEIDLPLTITLRRGKRALHHQERRITLKRGRQCFQDPVALKPELFASGPGWYRVEVRLGDRLLKDVHFQHKTRAQLKQEKAEALLGSLSLSEACLFTIRDGERLETDHVFATDRALSLSFCIQGQGFDDDAPVLQWQLGLKLLNLDSGSLIEDFRALQERAGKNIHADLGVALSAAGRDLRPGRYSLQLCKRTEVIHEFRFRILAIEEIVPYTEKIVVENLRAEGAQLLIQAGPTRYQSHYVPNLSDFVLPELTIHSAGYNSFLPRFQTRLRLSLHRGTGEGEELALLPVTLSAAPLVLRNLAVKVRDGALGATPGPCRLALTVANRQVASLAFQIVSHGEVLERVRASAVTLEAISKSGRQVRDPATLQLGEHEAFGVQVEIEVGILAPAMVLECALVLKLDNVVVAHTHSELRLHQAKQTLRGAKVRLASITPSKGSTPQELAVVVVIGGEVKGTRSIKIITGRRISNFEGQLTIDPHNLEVEESEYQEILSRL